MKWFLRFLWKYNFESTLILAVLFVLCIFAFAIFKDKENFAVKSNCINGGYSGQMDYYNVSYCVKVENGNLIGVPSK